MAFRKQPGEAGDLGLTLRFHRIYCVSLNKLITSLLASGASLRLLIPVEPDREAGIKTLLEALDQALFRWTKDLTTNMASLPRREVETYLRQVLLAGMNRAGHLRRMGLPLLGGALLENVAKLYVELKESHSAETQYICARFALARGTMHMETLALHKAFDALFEGITCLAKEQQIRYKGITYLSEERFKPKQSYKIRRNVSCGDTIGS